jgi:hypothetical protein
LFAGNGTGHRLTVPDAASHQGTRRRCCDARKWVWYPSHRDRQLSPDGALISLASLRASHAGHWIGRRRSGTVYRTTLTGRSTWTYSRSTAQGSATYSSTLAYISTSNAADVDRKLCHPAFGLPGPIRPANGRRPVPAVAVRARPKPGRNAMEHQNTGDAADAEVPRGHWLRGDNRNARPGPPRSSLFDYSISRLVIGLGASHFVCEPPNTICPGL